MTTTENLRRPASRHGRRSRVAAAIGVAAAALLLVAAPVTFGDAHLALNQAAAAASKGHAAGSGSGGADHAADSRSGNHEPAAIGDIDHAATFPAGVRDGHCGYLPGDSKATDC